MKRKVDCVVVTFNRLTLLKECLHAILKQNYPVENIFVIDNNSTDNTWNFLKKLSQKFPKIVPIHMNKNLGGAGGFNFGIHEFIKRSKSDYVWIMDDDTIPSESALYELTKNVDLINDLGFLVSNARWKDGTPAVMNVPSPANEWNKLSDKGLTKVEYASFVSIMFPRKVIEKIGLPITDYFIWGDDVEYTLRITQNGFEGYLVNNSIVEHKIKSNIGVDIITEADKKRIGRYYYSRRNAVFTERKRRSKKDLVKWIVKCSIIEPTKVLLYSKNYKFLRIKTELKGTIAGMFFNPTIEKVNEDEE
ncbi:glycosyltransferase family 2 protein [Lactobacillus agrestimuris]|uniref:glycosyltransferase family 2 protein n=1 Tax=Lactobacillus agrestimuris TaxID=2941328 RepID=UPI0020431258|nr:glycosyltransferase family 2 protein [Lactobacillus agrestimuris]